MGQFERQYDERIQSLTFRDLTDDVMSDAETCPAIILDTLSLALSSIDNKVDLVVSTPSRESFGRILAALLAVDYQLNEDEASRFAKADTLDSNFSQGDKLKMGNAIVEYVGASSDTGGAIVLYNPKSPITHTLTLEQSLLLQKTNSNRRLSPSKKFREEFKAIKESIGSAQSSEKLVNELKRKKTYSDTTIVYIGALNKTELFCKQTAVGGSALSDSLLCSRIEWDSDTELPRYSLIGKGQYSGIPSLAIAYDLKDVMALDASCLETLKAVVVDADNLGTFIEGNIEEIRDLHNRRIPMIVIVSNANSEAALPLRKEGFAEWRWDDRTLRKRKPTIRTSALEPRHGFFSNLRTKCENCSHFKIQLTTCKDEAIDTLYECMDSLDKLLGSDCGDEAIEDVRRELWMVLLCFIRAVVPYSNLSHLPGQENDSSWGSAIDRRKGYLSPDARELFLQAITIVNSLLLEKDCPKEQLLRDRILALEPGEQLTIVTRTPNESADAVEYWKDQIDADVWPGISFMPFASFKAQKTPISGRVIIPGWFGKDRMANVVYGYNAPIAEILLFQDCETNWYVNQSNAWKRSLIDRDDTAKVLSIPGVCYKKQLGPLPAPLSVARERTPIEENEEKWKLRTYSRHEAKGDERSQSVDAVPIRYAEDLIAFYRDRSALIDVTPVIEIGGMAVRRRVDDENGLKEGSFVLLRETDKDVIEQLADQLYLKESSEQTRRMARAWREALEKLYVRHNYIDRNVYEDLTLHGMDKGYQAFRTLRDDPDKIAPGRNKDEIEETIKAIARALGKPLLESQSSGIADSALAVQNAHRSAGRTLSRILGDAFARYLSDSNVSKPEDIWEPVPFDLDDLGDVKLYRIVEIDREHRLPVARWKIGKIFEE